MTKRVFSFFAVGGVLLGLVLVPGLPAQAVQVAQPQVVSADPADFTPDVICTTCPPAPDDLDGRVEAIVQTGNTIIIGGRFDQAHEANKSQIFLRSNILAFDATTGTINTTFAPVVSGEVTSLQLTPDGQSVYVGGNFAKIDSKGPQNLALLSVATGARVPGFTPPAFTGGPINDLRLSNGRLWIGGSFATIAGVAQPALATVNATTGAFDPYMSVVLSGVHHGGKTSIIKMDITKDGSRLVGVGNFVNVNGVRHEQAMMLDLTGASAAVANWQTAFYQGTCSSSFDSYMRDLDISPDGSYFVISTTGAYGGSTSPCDEQARWELGATGSNLTATWTNYTGGDTTYAVAITGSVVYVGGHFRWANNAFAGDRAGAGAVAREGIAALDPANGLPFAWNPGRDRGTGLFDMLATSTGLWVGSDTDTIGNEFHQKIAFFPLAGGTVIPSNHTGTLPSNVYLAGKTSGNPNTVDTLGTRSFDGTTTGALVAQGTGGIAWGSTRGAFMVNGVLYTGDSSGNFVGRTYDGTTFGTSFPVNTSDLIVTLAAWHTDVAKITGMFFYGGRIYYTISGTSNLFYRYFTPSNNVVGAVRFTAAANTTGVNWSQVAGMFQAGNKLYFASSQTGVLSSMTFTGGLPVAGTVQTITATGVDWRSRGLFLRPAGNASPTASFTSGCTLGQCSFDASASSDPDGFVASYSWDFGDGTTGTGVQPSHTYAASANYTVTLTVTDDQGATATTTQQVNVLLANVPPTSSFTVSCLQLTCSYDGSGSSDSDGTIQSYGWTFSDGTSDSGVQVNHTFPHAGTYTATLLVTDDRGGTGTSSTTSSVATVSSTLAFRAEADSNAQTTTPTVTVPGAVQQGDAMLLYASVAGATTVPDPTGVTGWTQVGGPITTGSLVTQVWQKVAGAGDAGQQVSLSLGTLSKVGLELVAYSGADPNAPVASFATAVDPALTTNHPVPAANVTLGGSWVVDYWADKSSTTTAWTAPAGQAVRATSIGTGSGRVTSLVTDTGSPLGSGPYGPWTATTDATSRANEIAVVLSPVPTPNVNPTASFSVTCTGLTCQLDGTGSSDSDGSVTAWAWDFGDGSHATGSTTSHSFPATGTYTVQLVVTDDRGGTGSTSQSVPVTGIPVAIGIRDKASVNVNAASASVTVPATVQPGDGLVLYASVASTTTVGDPTGVSGWAQLTGPVSTGSAVTQVWQKVAAAGDAGKVLKVTLGAAAKVNLELVAYSGTSSAGPVASFASAVDPVAGTAHVSPTVTVAAPGSWVLTFWTDKSSTTTTWTAPGGTTTRDTSIGTGSGRITSLVVDSGGPAGSGSYGGLTATTDFASRATSFTIVLKQGEV